MQFRTLRSPLSAAALLIGLSIPLGSTGCGAIGQLNLIPIDQDPALGAEAYPQLLQNEQLIQSGPEYTAIVEMTDRLVEAAREVNPDIVNRFEWEVKLVKRDDLVNAWALPGGKMAVYTGILPVAAAGTADLQTGLAVVMGHEIAHATLRHGTKAMTRQMGANAMVALGSFLIGSQVGESQGQMAALAGSFAANFGTLHYGRSAELEADRRGLLYMAKAGYDPREAVAFWKRMQAASGGQAPPEWLSTHPTNDRRIAQIEELLPEVLPAYEQSRGTSRRNP